jgi:hypothetical protein
LAYFYPRSTHLTRAIPCGVWVAGWVHQWILMFPSLAL